MSKRNPYARVIRDPAFRPKKIRAQKGKGSYSRKHKYKSLG